MIIKVSDIPPEGREVSFLLDCDSLSARGHGDLQKMAKGSLRQPTYTFSTVQSSLALSLQGTTILLVGNVFGAFITQCSRCAEEIQIEFDIPFQILLKKSSGNPQIDEEEDLELSFYHGEEIDCGVLAEEQAILNLPFTPLCSSDCQGLCSHCGTNLNIQTCTCTCTSNPDPSNPFTILATLK